MMRCTGEEGWEWSNQELLFLWSWIAPPSQHVNAFENLDVSWTSSLGFFLMEIPVFPGDSVVKNPPANATDTIWSLVREDSPEEGNVNPLQYFCLENPIDRGAWWATVHGVVKSWKQHSNWTTITAMEVSSRKHDQLLTYSAAPHPSPEIEGIGLIVPSF